MVTRAKLTLEAIDRALEAKQDLRHRWHLGASIIGQPCKRKVWYSHRWALREVLPGRVLRIFDRGHREEFAIHSLLRGMGITIEDFNPATGEQWRVLDHTGHFGGSLDALLAEIPDLGHEEPPQWVVGEFKTHNEKSFAAVSARGVQLGKTEHYVQMQVYMGEKKLKFALYVAVNKNDDDLYIELVPFDEDSYNWAKERAHDILNSDQPPDRVCNDVSFWMCRFCAFKSICHGDAVPEINCRTCAHVAIGDNGTWSCVKHNYVFTKGNEDSLEAVKPTIKKSKKPAPLMREGCKDHVFNPYMLNGVEFIGGDEAENYTTLRMPSGIIIENGPSRTPSEHILCLSDPSPIKQKPLTKASSTSPRKKKVTGS